MRVLSIIWSLLDAEQRRRVAILQALSVLMAFSTLGGVAAVLPFFAVLADPRSIHQSAGLAFLYAHLDVRDERDFSIVLGLAFVLLVLIGNAINLLGSRAIIRCAHSIGNRFSTMLFGEYLRREYGFHARVDATTLVGNVLFEAGRVTAGIVQNGLILVTHCVTILFVVVSITLLNPLLALYASSAVALSYGLTYFFVRRQLLRNGQQESEFLARRNGVAYESFAAIKEIIITRSQEFFVRKFAGSCERAGQSLASTQTIAHSPKYIMECLVAAGLVTAALLLSRNQSGFPWLAQLTFMAFAAYRILPSLQQIFYAVAKIRADSPALEGIAQDLRSAKKSAGGQIDTVDPSWRERPKSEIELRALSFRYREDLPPAVRDATLRIPAGKITALIGHNGAGKTALIDLIAGLLTPHSGRFTVDGLAIDASNRHSWQAAVAYVPQHIYLLDASIAENIAMGVAGRDIDRARMQRAAKLARVDEFVHRLPQGYETFIGERGIRLSGGQRQRLGIARALYREASLLILDEATNALDVDAEREVLAMLGELRGQRTVLVIAHSEDVIRCADFVYELSNGVAYPSRSAGDATQEPSAGGNPCGPPPPRVSHAGAQRQRSNDEHAVPERS